MVVAPFFESAHASTRRGGYNAGAPIAKFMENPYERRLEIRCAFGPDQPTTGRFAQPAQEGLDLRPSAP
jgi:hypothetical protein